MKIVVLYASVILASGLLFVNLYNSLIDVKSWRTDIPQSIQTARDYYRFVNPGSFFRIFSPVNQVLALIALIVFWRSFPGIRIFLILALALYVCADILTFAYFYPRNDFLFKKAALTDVADLKMACAQWGSMNWVRSLIVLAGLICSALALHRIYLTGWLFK